MARQSLSDTQVEQRREEILEAAMQLFEDGGLESVSLRKIAARLQCSYSTPYRYFASKDALLTSMRAQAFRWMEQSMLRAVDTHQSPLQRLNLLAEAFIRAGVERPGRYALMFFRLPEPETGPHLEELTAAKHAALDVCTRTVTAAHDSGALHLRTDPLTASHLFWAGAHGLVSLEISGQFVMGRQLDDLLPAMIQTLVQGLENASASMQTSNAS
ncbi:TetR family transcriptional regulator [Oceanococcus atlanticus]|uniref:TetR family transcriptional regulator n=1 Tax=Oceanococcus atlanticus TaxID=1317117 RepID=A0A1Y1SFZ8_9GAMM|nr:TetR/AcrR family transcriptional regulator [Oceanococcus atlanticus]ORE87452.1 TetR family transcriptional regulator [Oceanococcus atlanticus]